MKMPETLVRFAKPPLLTRGRIIFAVAMAVTADGAQFVLGPLGWFPGDQLIDVVAMVLAVWAVGFHLLLLPTFVLELLPVADLVPTWTGCVLAVIALRRRAQRLAHQAPPAELPPAVSPPQLKP